MEHLVPVRVEPADGRPLLTRDSADSSNRFIVFLGWSDGRIVSIRDFLYARYIVEGASIASIWSGRLAILGPRC